MLRSTALRSLRTATLASASASARPGLRALPFLCRCQARLYSDAHASIMDSGFWKSLVPKPLRRENRKALKKNTKKGEWNPMTFYIVMFLFIGSMSIQMIALRNSTDRYVRQSAVRIGLLKEIVERIQNGEDVDVEKLLGTGDAQKEADWEEGTSCKAQKFENETNEMHSPASH